MSSNNQRARSEPLQIRPACRADLASISACACAAYRCYVARIGRAPAPMVADFAAHIDAGQVVVIAADDQLLGYAVCYRRGDHVHLENIAVLPQQQGRGLGRRLLHFVEQQARGDGANAVELYTNEKMTENLHWYPALGYVETERRSEDGFRRVYFRKSWSQASSDDNTNPV